jgi:hypothetical protein
MIVSLIVFDELLILHPAPHGKQELRINLSFQNPHAGYIPISAACKSGPAPPMKSMAAVGTLLRWMKTPRDDF